jgi:hypothetical protein
MAVTALVVNRVQPRFADDAELASLPPLPPGPPRASAPASERPARPAAAEPGEPHGAGPEPTGDPGSPLEELIDNLRGYTDASDREEQAFADLVSQVYPAPVYRVPLLNTDVHDLAGLGTIADLLFAGPPAALAGEGDRER